MRALLCTWIVCVGVGWSAGARAEPSVRQLRQQATALINSGRADQALVIIDRALATAPNDAELLYQKGRALVMLDDLIGGLAAYQACLAARPRGKTRTAAEDIVKILSAVPSTFVEVTVSNGPATVTLEGKPLCTAEPTCKKHKVPGSYRVVVERSGFDRISRRITVVKGKTTTIAVTLVEKPSLLTVRVAQAGVRIAVDGTVYEQPVTVPAGPHDVVVTLEDHADARIAVTASEGKPIDLDVALARLVPIRVEPAGAELLLDGKPVAIEGGKLAVPVGPHVLVARAKDCRDEPVKIPDELPADYRLALELECAAIVARSVEPISHFSFRRKLALAAGGVAVAALAGGAVLGRQANQLDADAFALCPSAAEQCRDAAEATDLNQRARSRARQANIAFGAAAGAAIAATVLWLTGAPESRVTVTPSAGEVAGLDVALRF